MLISDIRIIKLFIIIACTITLISSCKYNNYHMTSETKNNSLLIMEEQAFWNSWISVNDADSCPLEPFVLSYTEEEIFKIDNIIDHKNRYSKSLLIVRANIDNGIFNIYYYGWDESSKLINYVKWDGLKSKIVQGQQKKDINLFEDSFNALKKGTTVDVERRNIFDGDSIYISLLHDGLINRFASYAPNLENYSGEFPINSLEYMQQYMRTK